MREKRVAYIGFIIAATFVCELWPLVFSYADIFTKILGEAQKLEKESAKIPSQQKAVSEKKVVKPAVQYNADKLKDPFQKPYTKKGTKPIPKPVQETVKQLPPMKVEGVFWGGTIPQAIINGRVVKVDDEIEGALVVRIAKEGVTLSFAGQQITLPSPSAEFANM
ncbi:MAG: general secretion pathway protein GspB [Candidatus Omnitrophica bacterium]|nr:general secretion pathway protein GspB [Candidatus Omnitrophota bacterium]